MIPFQLPQLVRISISPEDKTLNHILVFTLTFWRDWFLQSDMLLHGKKKIPFLKIKPLFSEKPIQLAFADSLHVLPVSGDGLSLTFPSSLYVVRVCFFRGLCFQCLLSFSLSTTLSSLFFLFWICCIFYFCLASALCLLCSAGFSILIV